MKQTATDKAYFAIKEGILSGLYQPGSRVTEHEIVESAGVSRTPVREAFAKLQTEGLVNAEPHQGVVVCDLSSEEALEIYELRAMLESYCARLAALRITPNQLLEMRKIAQKQHEEALKERPDIDVIGRLNAKFHSLMYVASGNQRLNSFLSSLIQPVAMRWNFTNYPRRSIVRSAEQHLQLLVFFERQDADAAEALIRLHVLAAQSDYVDATSGP